MVCIRKEFTMKLHRMLSIAGLVVSGTTWAQTVYDPDGTSNRYQNPPPSVYTPSAGYAPAAGYSPAPSPVQRVLLNSQQLDNLAARIALYPDALLAQVVMASTTPLEVADASRWALVYPNASDDVLAQQPWSPAVKTLVRYLQALELLAGDLAWTQQLGGAYQQQPVELMASVQRLRAAAQVAGTLYSTPQQQVISAGPVIQIVPAQPEVVYVPTYDPVVVYQPRPVFAAPPPRDSVRFSIGIRSGRGFDFDLDWTQRDIRPRTYVPAPPRPYIPPPSFRPGPPSWGRPGVPEYRGPRTVMPDRHWNHDHDGDGRPNYRDRDDDRGRWDRDRRDDGWRDDRRRDEGRRDEGRRTVKFEEKRPAPRGTEGRDRK
jgi:hypothetical protein